MTILGEELGTMENDFVDSTIPDEIEDTVEVETLGQCSVIKIHDDGDLTVTCGGKKYIVTAEGEIFEERTKEVFDE